MYQHDPSLDDLLRRPMQMASNEYDEYEEEYEDDEDDLFGDDVLQAAQGEEEGDAFEAPLSDVEAEAAAAPEPTPEQTKLFTRPGIRRNLIGYGLMTLFGFVPFVMLLMFGLSVGLSGTMMFFSAALLAGLALSVYNLIYGFQHGYEFTVSFDVRTYFRFWPEVIVISVVLIGLSFWNLGRLGQGNPLTLSGQAVPMVSQMNAPAETEEDVIFSSFDQQAQEPLDTAAMVEQASKVAGGAVGVVGAPSRSNDINAMLPDPVAGAAVGVIGGEELPQAMMPSPGSNRPSVLSSDNAFINSFFLGGVLCAAFGYALVIGLAGALFGLLRRFETPFSQKRVEIINIETGEVTADVQPIAPIMKPINIAARALIGLFYGASMGFALGLMVVLPLYIFFRNGLMNPNLAPMLQTLGLTTQPDLAFTQGVTLAGLIVPLVVILTKMAPQGMAVSEELMRQHYEIKPTGRFVPADQPLMAGGLANNPAAINFDAVMIPDDELETELANNRLMNELAMEDDNLTAEIIEEFGRDFESVFGIDTRELIAQPAHRQASVDRKKLASALDESFGELGNVPVEISAELGQATLPLTDWLNLREGTLVLLNKSADEDIDILFNGVRKGHGKLIVADDALAVRVSQTQFQSGNGHGSLI
ncbi:MAG: FliM/FliN family flagellar motor switch protein [Candidatus Sericytochromatia bacterium]|nr:FliM/FliN family flagellar motor switch protein [Candidatus Sericytochromatia bacterium]